MPKRTRDQDGIYSRQDSPYWWANWTAADGSTTRRSTGIRRQDDPRKEAAKAQRAEWLIAERTRQKPQKTGPTFDDLMVAYLDGPSLAKRSHERDLYSLNRLAPVFAGRMLAALNRADARGYVAERQRQGAAPATILKELGTLSAALNWARRELEWTVPNPFMSIGLQQPAGRARWLTHEEAAALLTASTGTLQDFIRLGLFTGMRKGEMLGLEWSRVDLARDLIYLGAEHQKSAKEGSIPTNAEARKALLSRARFRASQCPDSPWVFCHRTGERIQGVKRGFATACERAGLRDVHIHDLRRTFGSWLVQSGVPIHAVSALLRHSDIRVTDRVYAHLSPASLRDAAAVLDSAVSRSVSR